MRMTRKKVYTSSCSQCQFARSQPELSCFFADVGDEVTEDDGGEESGMEQGTYSCFKRLKLVLLLPRPA